MTTEPSEFSMMMLGNIHIGPGVVLSYFTAQSNLIRRLKLNLGNCFPPDKCDNRFLPSFSLFLS